MYFCILHHTVCTNCFFCKKKWLRHTTLAVGYLARVFNKNSLAMAIFTLDAVRKIPSICTLFEIVKFSQNAWAWVLRHTQLLYNNKSIYWLKTSFICVTGALVDTLKEVLPSRQWAIFIPFRKFYILRPSLLLLLLRSSTR